MKRELPATLKRVIKATSFWQGNSLILREFQHFPHILMLAIAFPLLAAVFEGFGLGFLLGFLQNLVNSNDPFQTGLEWFDINILDVNGSDFSRLKRVCGLILISTWLRALCNYLTQFYMYVAQVNLIDRLYKQIFEQLQALSLRFYSQAKGGKIINTLTTEVTQLRQSIIAYSFLFTKGSVLVVYALVALWISWQLTVVSLFLFTLTAVGLSSLNKRIREASFPETRARGEFISLAGEFISGIRTVQAFSTQDFERRRYYQASENIVQATIKVVRRAALIRPLAEAIASTILIGIIIAGMGILVANDSIETASLLTFLFVLFRLVPATQEVSNSIAQLNRFQGSIEDIKELLSARDKPYIQNGYRPFNGLQNSIEFVDVDFSYDSDTLVLRNICFSIEKGKTLALVGASGAGKSTVADLVARFYDATNGKILLDGINIREFDIDSVRHKMAIVSQNTFIFNASVRDNIAYGSEDATDEEILEAAELANAKEFIEELEQGFHTILGDRGVRLSGGQRQRIAIARALLRNPEILILDEATSALDSISEKLIQESIENLAVGRTVIAIAHRLSTISNADKIVVMEKGEIVEQGSFTELINFNGKFSTLYKIQHQDFSYSNTNNCSDYVSEGQA